MKVDSDRQSTVVKVMGVNFGTSSLENEGEG